MSSIRIALTLTLALAGRATLADDELGSMHEHRGLYLHSEIGGAFLQSTADTTPRFELSGGGLNLALALGASVSKYLVVAGEAWELVVPSPDMKMGSEKMTAGDDDSFALIGIGPKLVVYIAPESANVHVSVTPSFTRISLLLDGDRSSTKGGLGLRLSAGKEWWLGRSQWGIGVAGNLLFASNKDSGSNPPTWESVGGGVSFSATWN